MKAERRHELKTNTLDQGIRNLPEISREHGTKILVVVLAVLLVIFIVRQRVISNRESAARAAQGLDQARALINQLDEAVDMGMGASPTALAGVRKRVYDGATDALQIVLESADDPRLLAEARLAQGDLNWKLANFPDLPGAQTQPVLQFPRNRQDLLKAAQDSYQNVAEDPAAPPESVRTARLGLAAVYENRREWDKARAEYQRLVNDAGVPGPFKNLAQERLNNLELVQRPPLFGAPATAPATSTAPTTAASPTTTATAPTTTATAPTTTTAPSTSTASPAPAQR